MYFLDNQLDLKENSKVYFLNFFMQYYAELLVRTYYVSTDVTLEIIRKKIWIRAGKMSFDITYHTNIFKFLNLVYN